MPLNDHLAHRPKKGMIVRSQIVLDRGTVLFKLGHRFVHGVRQDDLFVISTPWWFSEGTVDLICRTTAGSNENLSEVFRRFGAIAKRWGGSADLIVKVHVEQPLVAYVGPGTVQDFRKVPTEEENNLIDLPLWVPSPSVPQIYAPVSGRDVYNTSIANSAFSDVYVVPIDKWDQSFIGNSPKAKWKYQ